QGSAAVDDEDRPVAGLGHRRLEERVVLEAAHGADRALEAGGAAEVLQLERQRLQVVAALVVQVCGRCGHGDPSSDGRGGTPIVGAAGRARHDASVMMSLIDRASTAAMPRTPKRFCHHRLRREPMSGRSFAMSTMRVARSGATKTVSACANTMSCTGEDWKASAIAIPNARMSMLVPREVAVFADAPRPNASDMMVPPAMAFAIIDET